MDVKCGRGAFMKTASDARALAESLCRTGAANQVRTVACVTAMDAPLGHAVGNSVEVIECVEMLKGCGPADLERLCLVLATQMLRLGGFAGDDDQAEATLRAAISSGRAIEKFRAMVIEQGGDPRVVDDYRLLPTAPSTTLVRAERSGYVTEVDAERVGRAAVVLGAGRNRVDDVIHLGVGVHWLPCVGDFVTNGDAVFVVHYHDSARLPAALDLLRSAFTLGDERPALGPLILETISP
jgi:pyrimidine-nucleoside phosphorylase